MGITFEGIPGAILMSLISFSIVFLVCGGLILVMTALKHFAGTLEGAGKKTPEPTPAETTKFTAAAHASPLPSTSEDLDSEVVAVIMAAVAASCGATAKIVSIVPTPQLNAGTTWRTTGRLQNCEGF